MSQVQQKKIALGVVVGFCISDVREDEINNLSEKARVAVREELNLWDDDVKVLQIVDVLETS